MEKQKMVFESGNELAAYAAKQINYHVMGYYPITPSTQIAENLDLMKAEGKHEIALIAAEGEHSAAGICKCRSIIRIHAITIYIRQLTCHIFLQYFPFCSTR